MNSTHQVYRALLAYIDEYRLQGGSILPDSDDLARTLDCEKGIISSALKKAQTDFILRRDEDGHYLVSDPTPDNHRYFSFTTSAEREGTDLFTILNEATVLDDQDRAELARATQLARSALRLSSGEDIILISRTRTIEGEPRVIHHAFLDPKRFPPSFLDDHNFSKISLIRTYQEHGYILQHRDTTLTSRLASQDECRLFGCQQNEPVLDAKQLLFATTADSPKPFVLEFLHATYKRWTYRIQNRISQPPSYPRD